MAGPCEEKRWRENFRDKMALSFCKRNINPSDFFFDYAKKWVIPLQESFSYRPPTQQQNQLCNAEDCGGNLCSYPESEARSSLSWFGLMKAAQRIRLASHWLQS